MREAHRGAANGGPTHERATMTLCDRIGRALVVAPHPDDEVLGCGGTIARLTALGRDVHVAVMTRGTPPRHDLAQIRAVQAEARAAHGMLGVAGHFLDFPAAGLDGVPHAQLNDAMQQLLADIRPDTVFLPFNGDIHADHRIIFNAVLVAARPRTAEAPARLYAYETLSETNWNAPFLTPGFQPNVFVDITGYLDRKLDAFRAYRSQVASFPGERSIEALRALATLRGATIYRDAAEGFVLIREIG